VVDVEQRALRAFEQHALSLGNRPMQVDRDIGDERLQSRPGAPHVAEHLLPLHVRVADEPVARGDVFAHGTGERPVVGLIGQVADADAATADFVLVRRADAARGGPDFSFAPPRFGEHVQLAVIRQDHVRSVAHEQPPARVDSHAGNLIQLRKQRDRIDHDAIADDADHAGMKDAGGNQMQDEFPAADVHGVAGVVSALIPRHDLEVRRQQIDDLPFAFIAPLGAEHAQIHAARMIISSAI
jgi:hypothetical protein